MEKHIKTAGLTDKFRPPVTKVCRICKAEKPIKDFAQNIKGRNGYANECKVCKRDADKAREEKRAEYAKNYFTFSFALLFSLTAFSQCDHSAFVFNLTPGVTRSGAWFSMEAGIWPVQGKFGATAGPVMYDEKITTAKGDEKLTQIDFIGRVIYKTVRGLYGASYRAYWSIGETQLIGVEPVVSRLGVGVNLIFTARL